MRRFLLDSVCCVLFIFSIMGLFASVTLFRIFDLFDPIGEMFSDFELTDLVMSTLREPPPASEDIVMVNLGYLDREGIAQQIDILSRYEPAAIGVDIYLEEKKTFAEDSLLIEVLKRTPKVILGDKLVDFNPDKDEFVRLIRPVERVARYGSFGFVNLLTDAADQDDLKSCREFPVKEMVNGEMQYAFGVKVAMLADSVKAKRFLRRGKSQEIINYKGNAMSFNFSDFGNRYFVLDVMDVFQENFTRDLLKDKVVIMCFMGAHLGDEQTRTDRYFTPLNKNYVGKAEPDMWGGVVHANIVSMILEEDYIDEMSESSAVILAVIICMFNVLLFKVIYGALPRWYDGITKIFQLCQVLLLVTLMIYLFDWFNYKADFTLSLVVIALSGDSIEVYHGVVKNLFYKRRRAELFKIKRDFLKEQ